LLFVIGVSVFGSIASAQANMVRCPTPYNPRQMCNLTPVGVPARSMIRARVMIGAPVPAYPPQVITAAPMGAAAGYYRSEGYSERYSGVEQSAAPISRGPCGSRPDSRFDDDNNECVQHLSAGQLARMGTVMHMDNDPNCGPGKSGTIYQSLENGTVVNRRCR